MAAARAVPPSTAARVPVRWLLVVLAVIAALGLLVSVQPFTGDQALFASGARQLARGDVLYRDVWDVKQPGIYWYYLVGGATVGWSEVALHLFELATLLAFSVLLAITTASRFRHPALAVVVPLLVVGTYYATAEPLQLGQVESLIGVPLFVALWCATRGTDRSGWWLVGAGAAGGLVLVLKLVFVPVVLAVWIVGIWPRSGSRRPVGRAVGLLLAGAAVPLGLTTAYLAVHDELGTVWWTSVDVPRSAPGLAGRPASRLIEGGLKTAARWLVPLALGGYGAVVSFRRGWDRLEIGLVAWTVTGIPVFLVQHWWIYQYAMFLVPVGIFAAHGLDDLLDRAMRLGRRGRVALGACAVVLALPLLGRIASNTRDVARHGFALGADDRAALRSEVEPNYREARAWARHLARTGPTPSGVYVLGNPLDVYVADRRQSVAINGWSPEQYPADVWRRLDRQLRDARPDEVVVDRFSARIMRERSPATLAWIRTHYTRTGGHDDDSWYRRDP